MECLIQDQHLGGQQNWVIWKESQTLLYKQTRDHKDEWKFPDHADKDESSWYTVPLPLQEIKSY